MRDRNLRSDLFAPASEPRLSPARPERDHGREIRELPIAVVAPFSWGELFVSACAVVYAVAVVASAGLLVWAGVNLAWGLR